MTVFYDIITQSGNAAISRQYLLFSDHHIRHVINGNAIELPELNRIVREPAILHQHFTNLVQKENGHHPCYLYAAKIIDKAKAPILYTDLSVKEMALAPVYSPSNHSKFSLKRAGCAPGTLEKTNGRIF